jgi:hypothetical protein
MDPKEELESEEELELEEGIEEEVEEDADLDTLAEMVDEHEEAEGREAAEAAFRAEYSDETPVETIPDEEDLAAKAAEEAAEKAKEEEPPAQTENERRLEERLRAVEGRYGGLNATIKELREKAASSVGDKPDNKAIKEALADGEKFKALHDEFPEWGEAMLEMAQVVGTMNGGVSENYEARIQQQSEKIEKMEVELRHKGWEDTLKTPEFQGWYYQQPEDVRALGASPNSTDAIKLLDHYKDHRDELQSLADKKAEEESKKAALAAREKGSVPATTSGRDAPRKPLTSEHAAFLAGYNEN